MSAEDGRHDDGLFVLQISLGVDVVFCEEIWKLNCEMRLEYMRFDCLLCDRRRDDHAMMSRFCGGQTGVLKLSANNVLNRTDVIPPNSAYLQIEANVRMQG